MERRRLQLANSSGGAINLTFYTEKVEEHDVCYGDFDELKNTIIGIAKSQGEVYEQGQFTEYYIDDPSLFDVNISIDDEDIISMSICEYENGFVEIRFDFYIRSAYVYSKCIYKSPEFGSDRKVLVSKLLNDGTQEIFAMHGDIEDIYIWFPTGESTLFTGSITNPFASGYKAVTGLSETEDGEPGVVLTERINDVRTTFITFDNQ